VLARILAGENLKGIYMWSSCRRNIDKRADANKRMLQQMGIHRHDPVFNLFVSLNLQLLLLMPRERREKWDDLADQWGQHPSQANTSSSWGNFRMDFQPWDGQGYNDTVDMTTWVVRIPSDQQWAAMAMDQRWEFTERLLGFGVFYVNWVRENGTVPREERRDDVVIMERCLQSLGLRCNAQFHVTVNVEHRHDYTKTYKELYEFVPDIFSEIIDACVGFRNVYDELVAMPIPASLEDLELALLCRDRVRKIVSVLRLTGATLHVMRPRLTLLDTLEDAVTILQQKGKPVAFVGNTGNGKSVTMDALIAM
jgi:hypothetical protein